MDEKTKEFIDFLSSGESELIKTKLYNNLKVQPNRTYCYYIMPLDNAIKALEAGGICCRNDLNNKYTDVSSKKIQHSREKELILNSSMDKEPVQVNK